jgi:phage tail-like protein
MSKSAQRLLSYLPAIYRDEPLAGRYLWPFEQLLEGLEQQIEELPRQLDPSEAREEFLPWLSSWVAFTLRADLDVNRQKQFLLRVVSLYRRRGTKENLYELLSIFTRGGEPTIAEDPVRPHYFKVTMSLPPNEASEQLRQQAIAHALIELEKPAHTYYDLDLRFPTMQIEVTSTIGVDTLIGTDAGTTALKS